MWENPFGKALLIDVFHVVKAWQHVAFGGCFLLQELARTSGDNILCFSVPKSCFFLFFLLSIKYIQYKKIN